MLIKVVSTEMVVVLVAVGGIEEEGIGEHTSVLGKHRMVMANRFGNGVLIKQGELLLVVSYVSNEVVFLV